MLCDLKRAEWVWEKEGEHLVFHIAANRFLRGIVRFCVFFLLEVGTGKMSLEEMQQIIAQEKILSEKNPAYPNGLFLSKVEYPFIQFKDSHHLIRMMKVGLE